MSEEKSKLQLVNPGDLLAQGQYLVVKTMTFKQWTDQHDDLLLEYSMEDAWEHWQKNGPRIEVLNSDGEIEWIWSK